MKQEFAKILVFCLFFCTFLLFGAYVLPWKNINWGVFELKPTNTITVIGEAKEEQENQIASFTAGVSAVNDDKDLAIAEVNDKIKDLTDSVKNFGVDEKDIQTQNISIYQNEESYYEGGRQKSRLGQWRANNSISIELKDISKANELADLLAQSGATDVYGPNFTVDDTSAVETQILTQAVDNAKQKAEEIAASANRRLGKVLSINEGGANGDDVYKYGLGGGGYDLSAGSATISKTVTVTFELK